MVVSWAADAPPVEPVAHLRSLVHVRQARAPVVLETLPQGNVPLALSFHLLALRPDSIVARDFKPVEERGESIRVGGPRGVPCRGSPSTRS